MPPEKFFKINPKNLHGVELDFYMNSAISAMQGIQENGTKLGVVADLLPKRTAELAFDMADAMLSEFRKRVKLDLDK